MDYYISALQKYAVFSGRAQRKEYWMFFLSNFIISFGLGFLGGLSAGLGYDESAKAFSWSVNIYGLAILLPNWAVGVRRIHDTGHSGWWILMPLYNIYLLCIDSTPGDNKYGPNPKGEGPVPTAGLPPTSTI